MQVLVYKNCRLKNENKLIFFDQSLVHTSFSITQFKFGNMQYIIFASPSVVLLGVEAGNQVAAKFYFPYLAFELIDCL